MQKVESRKLKAREGSESIDISTSNNLPATLHSRALRGMTLIEILVAVSIMLTIFVGFFSAYTVSADVASGTRARASATALLTNTMEYIRSLPYASVGTLGGTPSGNLLQNTTQSVNGVSYTLHTAVVFKDDAGNGLGSNDYKVVKVEARWTFRGVQQSASLVSYVAP
ncbi:MAG: prepilin-type N-terminal cleavage/methylation domain-containing protein [Patescibacteria group bacterium]